MPRRARSIVAGGCYHVINRGNNRATVFHDAAEYAAFIGLLSDAQERTPVELFAACLMPNHFHLVVRPDGRHDIGRWIHWLLTTHSHRYHLRHETTGRVWQGPYKAFPIEQDGHLLTVLRYVERNAVRAGLVTRSRDWPWGSAAWRHRTHHRNRLRTPAPPGGCQAGGEDQKAGAPPRVSETFPDTFPPPVPIQRKPRWSCTVA